MNKWVDASFLKDKTLRTIPVIGLDKRVVDYWDDSGGWKWDSLKGLLPGECFLNLASIPMFPNSLLKDKLIWGESSKGESSNGTLSFESTDVLSQRDVVGDTSPSWKAIWKLQVPEKIWLVHHGAILMNSAACSLCK